MYAKIYNLWMIMLKINLLENRIYHTIAFHIYHSFVELCRKGGNECSSTSVTFLMAFIFFKMYFNTKYQKIIIQNKVRLQVSKLFLCKYLYTFMISPRTIFGPEYKIDAPTFFKTKKELCELVIIIS